MEPAGWHGAKASGIVEHMFEALAGEAALGPGDVLPEFGAGVGAGFTDLADADLDALDNDLDAALDRLVANTDTTPTPTGRSGRPG